MKLDLDDGNRLNQHNTIRNTKAYCCLNGFHCHLPKEDTCSWCLQYNNKGEVSN